MVGESVIMQYKEGLTIGLCGGQGGTRKLFVACRKRVSLRVCDTMTLRFDDERKARRLDVRTMVFWNRDILGAGTRCST